MTIQMIKDFGIVEYLLQPALNDIFQAQISTMFLDSSYITNRLFDVQMIESLRKNLPNEDIIDNSKLISDDLFHRVPFISDVRIDDIIQLREKDGQSFLVYKDKINKILKSYDKLDRKAILDIQRDIINPELHLMERSIKNNRKNLLKSIAKDTVLTSVGVGIGVFSGLLPIDYAAIVGVMGGIPAISNLASNVRKCASDDIVKNNNFYFLFQLDKKYKSL